MTKIAFNPNVNGTGTFTISAPNSNTDRTFTLPDSTGTVLTSAGGTMTGDLQVNTRITAGTNAGDNLIINDGIVDARWALATGGYNLRFRKSNPSGVFEDRVTIDNVGRVTMPYQPSFRALSPPTGNYTTVSGGIIPFNTTAHNIGGHFNTTNSRFTAPVAGTYLFCFSGFNNGSSGERISIVVNGSTKFAQGSRNGSANDWDMTAIFVLSANDFVDVRSTYGGATIYLAPAHTEFAGFFLG